jgi:HD-GYP domain-containing protein (c-di-GMP phosphodiesterase class II)
LQKLDAYDDYLLVHSTNVCYLGLLLGNRLEEYLVAERRFKSYHEAKDLQLLGLGMLLHDIGKTKLPREILDKPGPLTREELELVRSHTILGYNMVRGRLPPSAAQIVLNHHQRYDGRGYPRLVNRATGNPLPPMQGRQIPIFSRIATVVDVYDAATTQRVYSPRKLPVRALHEMRTICRGFFDPEIERAFYEIVPPFPIGQAVTLSDGSEAVVVDFNPRRPTRPKVQILSDPYGGRVADPSRHEIDLALHDHLHVARVDGEDVTPYLSVPEESVPLAT